ncbi:MAG: amidohydrolase family protein [Deinococcota bacterium]
MHYDQVVSGGTLVLPSGLVQADLGIQQGRIVTLGQGLLRQGSTAATEIDSRHLLVLPGLIDPHVHPIHAETYASVSEAALFGGVTTVLHHLYTPPDADPVTFFQQEVEVARQASLIDFGFHVRLNDLNRTQHAIADIVKKHNPSFKLFMAYGGRGISVGDDEILLAMRAAHHAGGVLLFHAENGPAADLLELWSQEQGQLSLNDYYNSRPKWVEVDAVERLIRLHHIQPCSSYLVHLTCAASMQAVSKAKLAGIKLTAETCPHYLLLTAETASHLGSKAKMSPPLRTQHDQDALWQALAGGTLDTVGSDHSAFEPAEKEVGDNVFKAGYGVPGIATMLPLLYQKGVHEKRISIEGLITAMSANPAKALGLTGRKGYLAVGYDADFVLFDPDEAFTITDASEHGNGYYSLYEGWQGKGVVKATYQRGTAYMVDNELVVQAGHASFVERTLPLL